MKRINENPTVCVILCKTKNDTRVKITLPQDSNLSASGYQLNLPSKEELKKKLIAWSEDFPEHSRIE